MLALTWKLPQPGGQQATSPAALAGLVAASDRQFKFKQGWSKKKRMIRKDVENGMVVEDRRGIIGRELDCEGVRTRRSRFRDENVEEVGALPPASEEITDGAGKMW